MARPPLRGPNGQPTNVPVRAQRPERRLRQHDDRQEFVGNVPVGDEHNIRGLAATGSRVGSAIRGTRPDLDVIGRLEREGWKPTLRAA
jgi:hypothetical protein